MKQTDTQHGFIALMSVIIVSVILLLIATTLSLSGFYGRYDILDSELKERSTANAEACIDQAVLELANNPSFLGNATTTISGTYSCYIGLVDSSVAGKFTFKTRSMYQNMYTNVKVTVNSSTFDTISWEETTIF